MPTENRSSTIEQNDHIEGIIDMVSVQETIESLEEAYAGDSALGFMNDAANLLRRLVSQPSPQHHAEPIAWIVGTAFWWTKEEAERDAAATGLPIVGLGPMSDPGEVERLRDGLKYEGERAALCLEELQECEAQRNEFYAEITGLRAQLAERDALLGRVVDHANFWRDHPYAEVVEAIAKDYKALSASAEPSAPVERDGRDSWLNDWFLSLEPGRQAVLREDKWMLANAAFEAGYARAALAPKQ